MTSKNLQKGHFAFVPIYFLQGCLGNNLTRTGVESLYCSSKNVYKVERSLSQGEKGQFQMSRHQNFSFELQILTFQADEYILSSLSHAKLVKRNCPKRIFLFWWQKIGKKTISSKWKCSKTHFEARILDSLQSFNTFKKDFWGLIRIFTFSLVFLANFSSKGWSTCSQSKFSTIFATGLFTLISLGPYLNSGFER